MPDAISLVVYYAVFLVSVVLHEAAHAFVAWRGGDPTAYHGGQVSLDPRPHIKREPFGMVVMPLVSLWISGWPFGFASAPYDREWAMAYPRRAAVMALAGPAANLLLAVLAGVLIRVGMTAGLFTAPGAVEFGRVTAAAGGLASVAAFALSVLFSMNLVLLALNIIPLPPLDGSAAIPLVLSDAAADRYQQFIWSQPGLAWIGMLIAWQMFGAVFRPIFLLGVNLLYPGVQYG